MVKVRVPATSANMGPGFDSMGVALKLYNYITAEETEGGLSIEILDETKKFIPTDERNLVYKAMKAVYDEAGIHPKGVRLTLENHIPVTKGLGSSSAGIIGGMAAANALIGKCIPENELLNIASKMEGHPDNVAPALLGGFTVNVMKSEEVRYVRSEVSAGLIFAAFVPEFTLQTKKSRSILPKIVSHKDAVYNTGHSTLLAASLITGKYENIRASIGDRLHQKYRSKLIPGMERIFDMCYENHALGVYLSGAGPTIMAVIEAKNKGFFESVNSILKREMNGWRLHMLEPDNEGTVAYK